MSRLRVTHPARRLAALALAVALVASPHASRAGAPTPVVVDCNAGTLVLDTPGSYVLGDDTADCNLAPAIQITASKVVLDLGGRTLDGADQNGTTGIIASGEKVVIRNGTVRDFGVGIALAGAKGVLDGVVVAFNVNQGIILNDGALVTNSRSQANGGSGLEGVDGNLVRRSVFTGNGGNGVLLGDRNVLVGNTANGNGVNGFALFDDNTLLQNIAAFNTQRGFSAGERSIFKNNTANTNGTSGIVVVAPTIEGGRNRLTGNVAVGNGLDGIYVDGTNLIEKNRAAANQGHGIFGHRGTFKGNAVSGNRLNGMIIDDAVAAKNTSTGNRIGIAVNGTSAVLTANVATANATDGISFVAPPNAGTQIVKNVVHANGEQGIDLPDGAAPAGTGKNSARGNLESPQCDAELCP